MAFNNNLAARLDELRSPNPSRMHSENTTGQNTPSFRYSGSFMSPNNNQTPIETPNLQRRFTTDLSKMQNIGPIGQPPNQIAVSADANATTLQQQLEKKKQEYELAAEQRKQYQAQVQFFSQQEAREKQEMEQMKRELQLAGINPGYQSEPTTPPERREQQYSSAFPRTNRYSISNFASPPTNTRSSRSGSQLTSPPSDLFQISKGPESSDSLPSKSVPSSRRGSNDRATIFVPETTGSARRNATGANRYSMPATGLRGRTHESVPEHSPCMDMEHLNTTSFLFDDDEKSKEPLTSPDVSKYLQMSQDKFPVLLRNNEYSGSLSASSAALDLASAQSHAHAQSLVQDGSVDPFEAKLHRLSLQHNLQSSSQAQNDSQSSIFSTMESKNSSRPANRHSMEATLAAYSQSYSTSQGQPNEARPSLVNSHASYSTNDVPTLKNANGLTNVTPPKSHSQHFHNHNASLGRIPTHAQTMGNRQSREISANSNDAIREDSINPYQPSKAVTNAPVTVSSPVASLPSPSNSIGNQVAFPNQPLYAGYGMQLMNMGINPMMASPLAFQNQIQAFQQQNGFLPYTNYAQQARFQDGQSRMTTQRRMPQGDDQSRFLGVKLESLRGEILGLCKDQHGCRYLQKKLEERSPENVHIIFLETYQHVVDLMTDPFGNYLCQKLLEFANDEQRTMLVNNAAPEMVKIAFNSHGTRALQKMIEFISTPEQIQTIINALDHEVVEMIQDLNGNHVIQKCLNHLSSIDAQFIFDAVGINCVAVGTHRHGCCVLQRCIDHASGTQKAHLISQITEHAFHLVQDPFGNYVLQYIIDLQEPCFTNPLCHIFRGQIPQLSKQKFSSNVIEKCLRGADTSVTRLLIDEMLNSNELEKMLRDSYANYVVQTAMDYADVETKTRLIEAVRPILPMVRHTPHGRRIQSKIMQLDGHGRFSSGNGTPNDRSSGQVPLSLQMANSQPNSQVTHLNSYSNLQPSQTSVNNYPNPMNNAFQSPFASQYPQYGLSNGSNFSPLANENIQTVQQPSAFPRLPQVNGGFF
ncbi:uncharacterized protein KY384_000272 [Bacidia gigantensis]|uniref:uncharacterized protein n=1 Tax=Bacidia gigantensis TaxID=2732470 RepID=UPI001D0476D3|nr:uncharacterized protein KY384_000272 [Bacidia gigantensis]KAG8526279.1 hypothetical protein KY384_000272 [Bacidia gigantensis]